MKICRFSVGDKAGYGIVDSDIVKGINGDIFQEYTISRRRYRLDEIKLLTPCIPSKIVALGLNYHTHAKEFNLTVPGSPQIFLKPSTAVIGPGDNIVYPNVSARVDYEGELAVVIKKTAWIVPLEEAPDYVLGYTCFNDVTARDLQNRDLQWTRAKGFNTFAAIGPWIETEFSPGNASLETYLNGDLKQKASTSDLIFPVPELISFISHIMTLLPGDIIATGTPSGVGPMNPGDTIEVKIESIGTLRNYVVKQPPARTGEEPAGLS